MLAQLLPDAHVNMYRCLRLDICALRLLCNGVCITGGVSATFLSWLSQAHLTEQIHFYFNQHRCLHRLFNGLHLTHTICT